MQEQRERPMNMHDWRSPDEFSLTPFQILMEKRFLPSGKSTYKIKCRRCGDVFFTDKAPWRLVCRCQRQVDGQPDYAEVVKIRKQEKDAEEFRKLSLLKLKSDASQIGVDLRNPAALTAFLQKDFLNAQLASTPGGIEEQELMGQQELVMKDMLPKEGPIEKLEMLGFVFGEDIDEVFRQARLPAGWKKEASEGDSYRTTILDERNRPRVYIFYKAAFYDRHANMSMMPRFTWMFEPQKGWGALAGKNPNELSEVYDVAKIYDCRKVVHTTEAVKRTSRGFMNDDKLRELVEAWFQEHGYPEWRNADMYWEEEGCEDYESVSG